MNITGTHANFSVDDIEKAKEFYQGLGFMVVHEHEGGVFMESPAGTHVEIYEKADHEPWDSTVFGIEVDDVSQALSELKSKGIDPEPVEGADDQGIARMDGFEAAWFKDPAGNWLCVNNISA